MELNTIKAMERYARQDAGVISLGQGIPAQQSHDYIKAKAIEAITNNLVDSYSDPQGLPELRHALSRHLRQKDMHYTASEIIVTSGAIEALATSLRSVITDARKSVIVPTPVYSAYFKLIELARGTPVEIKVQEANNWALETHTILNSITEDVAAILLCNPNNPTGTVYGKNDLEQIVREAQRCGVTVIIDEVYSNMVYGAKTFYTPASNPAYKDTVIRITSFSKDFAVTGWRIGYMHASADRIAGLLGVHDTLVNCAPVVSQYAALAALDIYDDVIRTNSVTYENQRQYVGNVLDELSDVFEYSNPQGAYFFFPRIVSGETSHTFALRLLEVAGVVVVPGVSFGAGGEHHVRLCFGRNTDSIALAMERLRQARHKMVE